MKEITSIEKSFIQKFVKLFSIKGNIISKELLEEQQTEFGFTLYLLHNYNIKNALKLGIENSRNIIEKQKSILQIPHTYIFGGLFVGGILRLFNLSILFLPIFFLILSFSVIKILKIIGKKMYLLKTTRVFFNLSLIEAENLNNEFLTIQPFKAKPQMWTNSNTGSKIDGNSLPMRIFLFLFGQPFIYGHLHFFGGIPFFELFIYDIFIFSIIFGFFEKIIMFFALIYYYIYFFIIDNFPKYFGKENQKNDFFLDLYKLGNKSIKNIEKLKDEVNSFKKGIIYKNLGYGLTNSIFGINEILEFILKNEEFLKDNLIFKKFLKNLVNELIDEYLKIFEYLEEKISIFQKQKNYEDIKGIEKQFFKILVEQNLGNKIIDIKVLKNKINAMKL